MVIKYEIKRLDWTPNPNAFKLILNEKVTAGAGLNFTNLQEAMGITFVEKLIQIKDVESIFLKDNFITITQTPEGAMNEIHNQAVQIIHDAEILPEDQLAKPDRNEVNIEFSGDFDEKSEEEKMAIINLLLDKEIRPGLAMDGGGLTVLELQGNVLKVRYQGACGSCPSASAGTLQFISQLVQNRLSPNIQVVNS